MTKKNNWFGINKLFISLFLLISFFVPACIVKAVQDNSFANDIKTEKKQVTYKLLSDNKGAVVSINNKQIAWLIADTQEYSVAQRAEIFSNKLKQLIDNKIDPNAIRPYKSGKFVVVKAGDFFLFTADKENAKKFGVSTHELAFEWANSARKALGASELIKDYSLVVSRGGYSSDFEKNYLGAIVKGVASWYGHPFHGQTSSDGSRYNMYEFTAAHKQLPFGTLVKVTNLKTDKSCVVKITDRGPYIDGREIDLSKNTANHLGMLASGISKVQLEIVGKY